MTKQCRSRNQHQDGYKTYQELVAESKDKEDERMDMIARNWNDGEHYELQKESD